MAAKKTDWGKLLVGAGLTAVGLFIASPAEELAEAAATGGASLVVAPLQLPLTAVIGGTMATAGVGLIISAVGGK